MIKGKMKDLCIYNINFLYWIDGYPRSRQERTFLYEMLKND
jgi:hypothetical protein